MPLNKINEEKKSVFYLDVLSVLSAFAVVMLHNNLVIWQYPTGKVWISGVFIDSFFYFAVPIFFMISGVTLIDYSLRCSLKDYFIRRFKRAFVPFILCSAAAFLIYAPWSLHDFATWDFYKSFILDVLNYRYMNVYWFFIPLFAIYLSMPVLTQIRNKVKTFTYMIIYGLITLVAVPFFCNLFNIASGIGAIASPLTGSFLLFALIGYVLHNTSLPRAVNVTIYAAGAAGWLMMFAGTLACTPLGGPFSPLFRGYLNLPAILQASALFLLFKNTNWEQIPCFLKKIINFIKPHTLGIYLIHMHIIGSIAYRYIWLQSSLLYRTLGSVLIFVICLFLSNMLAQIPVTSWAMGKSTPNWLKKKLFRG